VFLYCGPFICRTTRDFSRDESLNPAGYRAPYELPRQAEPEPHIDVERPGELVGFDCFFVGRLRGAKGVVWQLSAIDCYSSFAWAELVVCRPTTRTPGKPRSSPAGSPPS
jgi:hypothetical protein